MDKHPDNKKRLLLQHNTPSKFDDARQDASQNGGAKLPLLYSAQKDVRRTEDIAYFFPDDSQNKLESQIQEDVSQSQKKYCTNCLASELINHLQLC